MFGRLWSLRPALPRCQVAVRSYCCGCFLVRLATSITVVMLIDHNKPRNIPPRPCRVSDSSIQSFRNLSVNDIFSTNQLMAARRTQYPTSLRELAMTRRGVSSKYRLHRLRERMSMMTAAPHRVASLAIVADGRVLNAAPHVKHSMPRTSSLRRPREL